MKRKNEEPEEVEEEDASSEEVIKKEKRKEAIEKRKNAKKRDKVARWGGLILLGLILFVGFLLWVFGEMTQGSVAPITPPGENLYVNTPTKPSTGRVIVR